MPHHLVRFVNNLNMTLARLFSTSLVIRAQEVVNSRLYKENKNYNIQQDTGAMF